MNIILYEPFCSSAGRTKRPFLPIDKQIMCKTFLVHTSICGKRTPPRQPAGAEPTYKILIFHCIMQQYLHRIATCKNRLSSCETVCFFPTKRSHRPPARLFRNFFFGSENTAGTTHVRCPRGRIPPRPRSEETAAHGTVILFPSFGIVKRLDIGMYRIERRQEIERLHPFGQQYEYGIIA